MNKTSNYTDAEVQAVVATLVARGSHFPSPLAREVLDAVAPAIAARAKAEALREAADMLDESSETVRELADRFGGYYSGTHSAYRASATRLRDRADEIEASQ